MSPWITNDKIYRVIVAILRILIRDQNLVNVATYPEKLSIVVQMKKNIYGNFTSAQQLGSGTTSDHGNDINIINIRNGKDVLRYNKWQNFREGICGGWENLFLLLLQP